MLGTIKKISVAVLLAAGLLFGTGCRDKEAGFEEIRLEEEQKEVREENEENRDQEHGKKAAEDVSEEETAQVVVFVCGAVVHPGVYELSQESRIRDALEAAGGMTEEAAYDYLNQAAAVKDGERIYVPRPEEVESGEMPSDGESGAKKNEADAGKVNLNTASKEELMTLPGIGAAKAQSIVRYREEHGRFERIEDIMEIEGIKSGVFQKIQDEITVS